MLMAIYRSQNRAVSRGHEEVKEEQRRGEKIYL